MNVVHDVTIDLLNPRKNVVHVVQEDSMRTLRLTLLSGSNPFSVAQGADSVTGVVEYANMKNGYSGSYSETTLGEDAVTLVSGTTNVWLVALDSMCFKYAGATQVNVRFERNDGHLLRSFGVMFDVEQAAGLTRDGEPSLPLYDGGVVYG